MFRHPTSPQKITTNVKTSCAPLDIQISKLVVVDTQFVKIGRTKSHLVSSTKSRNISSQKFFLEGKTT
jgi:hypothetical protein